MTRDEAIAKAKQARDLGDEELELQFLLKAKELDLAAPQAVEATQDTGSPILNAFRGVAARGNQAMTALNPLADAEDYRRIAAEQEWVKTHPGAGVGSMLADVALTAPAGGAGGAVLRSLASGAIEGATTPGWLGDKFEAALFGTAGAGIGEGLSKTLGVLVKPFEESASAATKKLIQKANALGIDLNAAQVTGNKALQYLDSALDFIPSSAGMQQAKKDAQRAAWQKALYGLGHQVTDGLDPDVVMRDMKKRISGVYDDVANRNDILMDQQLKDALTGVADERNLTRMDANKRALVQSYLDEFNAPPVGSTFSGKGYQNTRSMLDRQAKAMRNSNPAESDALLQIRNEIDAAMGRSVSPADQAAWKQANNDWMVMKNVEKSIDPVQGDISANRLLTTLKNRDPNRVIYGAGDQKLTDAAKIGKEFISPKTSDSGTAQRQAMIKLLTGAGAAGAAEEYARTHDPLASATGSVASAMLAALLPRQAAKMLWRPDGYFSKGLADLSKDVIPGVARQRIIDEMLRNAGLQFSNEMRQ